MDQSQLTLPSWGAFPGKARRRADVKATGPRRDIPDAHPRRVTPT